MKGKWIGKYWFSGKVPSSLEDRETAFELNIDTHENSKISGSICDTSEVGGTPGVGSFSGTVTGHKIKFVKRMPILTAVLPDGTRLEEEKPHRPIYYEGTIDPETGLIQGTWKFKFGIGFIKKRLAIYPGTKGKWEMKKST